MVVIIEGLIEQHHYFTFIPVLLLSTRFPPSLARLIIMLYDDLQAGVVVDPKSIVGRPTLTFSDFLEPHFRWSNCS